MKQSYIFIFVSLLIMGTTSAVFLHAAEEASPELIAKGETLFKTKGGVLNSKYACILCHTKDKALQRVKIDKLGDQLPDSINNYLVKEAKGKAIPRDGEDMKALMAYIKYKHSV